MSDMENRLRNELAHRSEQAPPGAALAEQIIAAASGSGRRGRRGWPTWALPILAAGAVAAIVAGVFVGVAQIRPEADHSTPPVGNSNTVASSPSETPLQSHQFSTAPPQKRSSTSSETFDASRYAAVDNLQAFRAVDFTFYGEQEAWAVGSAKPLTGDPGRAPAMIHTTDGGQTWQGLPTPTNGAQSIRFANDKIGYAWNSSSLVITTDGGHDWGQQLTGDTLALETFDNNVIRIVDDGGVHAEIAGVGSANWQKASLPDAPAKVTAAQLVRSDAQAYTLVTAATGAPTLYRSSNDGATWTTVGNACPDKSGTPREPSALAASPGGVLTVVCQTGDARATLLSTSDDGGSSFAYARGTVPADADNLVAGDPRTVLVVGGATSYTSTNGGASWQPAAGVSGAASFVGFESKTLGRIVTDGGATVWTTTDAGGHWIPFTFPS